MRLSDNEYSINNAQCSNEYWILSVEHWNFNTFSQERRCYQTIHPKQWKSTSCIHWFHFLSSSHPAVRIPRRLVFLRIRIPSFKRKAKCFNPKLPVRNADIRKWKQCQQMYVCSNIPVKNAKQIYFRRTAIAVFFAVMDRWNALLSNEVIAVRLGLVRMPWSLRAVLWIIRPVNSRHEPELFYRINCP